MYVCRSGKRRVSRNAFKEKGMRVEATITVILVISRGESKTRSRPRRVLSTQEEVLLLPPARKEPQFPSLAWDKGRGKCRPFLGPASDSPPLHGAGPRR